MTDLYTIQDFDELYDSLKIPVWDLLHDDSSGLWRLHIRDNLQKSTCAVGKIITWCMTKSTMVNDLLQLRSTFTLLSAVIFSAQAYELGKDDKLSFCDKNDITEIIHFSHRPNCPTTTLDTEIDQKLVDVLIFKPNIKAEIRQAMKCMIRVAWQRAEMSFLGADMFHEAGINVHSIPVDECRNWKKTYTCNLDKYKDKYAAIDSRQMKPVDQFTAKYSFSNKPLTFKTYSTKNKMKVNPPWALSVKNFTAVNCIAEETFVKASGNYETIFVGDRILYNINKTAEESPLMVGSSIENGATFVWETPTTKQLCSYILHEWHAGVFKVTMKKGDNSKLAADNEPFSLVMSTVQKTLYIEPKEQKIALDSIDYPHCISNSLLNISDVEIFKTTLGSIVAVYPHEKKEQVHTHLQNDKLVINNLQMSLPGDVHNHTDIRLKRQTKATREHLLLDFQELSSQVRFYSNKMTDWVNKYKSGLYKQMCDRDLINYDFARILAHIYPSAVLSTLLNKEVSATQMGDVFALQKCAKLDLDDYQLEGTLRYKGKCFSYPLIRFKYKERYVIGQVKQNNVFYPPIFTENCEFHSIKHFKLSGIWKTFKDYKLTDINFLTDVDAKMIELHSRAETNGEFPDFTFQLNNMRPTYSVTEEKSCSNFEDFINSRARSRLIDNKLREKEMGDKMNIDHRIDLADIGLAIGNFAGGVVGSMGKLVEGAARDITSFFGKVINSPLGKIGALVLGIMVSIGGMYSFIKLVFFFITAAMQYYTGKPFNVNMGGFLRRNKNNSYMKIPQTNDQDKESAKLISFEKASA